MSNRDTRCPVCRAPATRRSMVKLFFGDSPVDSNVQLRRCHSSVDLNGAPQESMTPARSTLSNVNAAPFRYSGKSAQENDDRFGHGSQSTNSHATVSKKPISSAAQMKVQSLVQSTSDASENPAKIIRRLSSKDPVPSSTQTKVQSTADAAINPAKIKERRATKDVARFAFDWARCIFCDSLFVTCEGYVVCKSCIGAYQ